jgi:hypothetical protein
MATGAQFWISGGKLVVDSEGGPRAWTVCPCTATCCMFPASPTPPPYTALPATLNFNYYYYTPSTVVGPAVLTLTITPTTQIYTGTYNGSGGNPYTVTLAYNSGASAWELTFTDPVALISLGSAYPPYVGCLDFEITGFDGSGNGYTFSAEDLFNTTYSVNGVDIVTRCGNPPNDALLCVWTGVKSSGGSWFLDYGLTNANEFTLSSSGKVPSSDVNSGANNTPVGTYGPNGVS